MTHVEIRSDRAARSSRRRDEISEQQLKRAGDPESLAVSTTGTNASAALARSLFLYIGFMFRRPSKLFRPSRVNMWAGLRQLALSADQRLSPSFIRTLMKSRSGAIAMSLTLLPPLVINTTLGFLLFTSHSFFSLCLARLPFFQRRRHPDDPSVLSPLLPISDTIGGGAEGGEMEDPINLHTLLAGPSVIPAHPTLLSGIAGAGAGLIQGLAFTPVENVVRLLSESASSITATAVRILRLPFPKLLSAPSAGPISAIPTSPLDALKTFLSSDSWRKSPSWWTGWRWAIARDAVSYGLFFATFDLTRRISLRVKAFFGGPLQRDWSNILVFTSPVSSDPSVPSGPLVESTTTTTNNRARLAQAVTIVSGGVLASLVAEMAGRPFRTCQKVMIAHRQLATLPPSAVPSAGVDSIAGASARGRYHRNPIAQLYRDQGLRPFLFPDGMPKEEQPLARTGLEKFARLARRVGWRVAAVGPWGAGFLVWAYVGGDI